MSQSLCFKHRSAQSLLLVLRPQSATPAVSVIWPCTWLTGEQLRTDIRKLKASARGPFGVNFVLGFSFDDNLALALSENVPIVSFFWGDASAYVQQVKSAGAIAMQVVASVRDATIAEKAGFDIVVAQGREAGGHVRGEIGTMALIPQVVDAVRIPVIAAGGIGQIARGVAAALALGAAGVWVGTPFLLAREANIHPVYRDLIKNASGEDTVYSSLFDIGWPDAPQRTLRNTTIAMWEREGRPSPTSRPYLGETVAYRADRSPIPRYHFAAPTREMTGNIEAMALYAGQSVGLVREENPASAIVQELLRGFQHVAGPVSTHSRASNHPRSGGAQ
jgi:nitronate monooxygenase